MEKEFSIHRQLSPTHYTLKIFPRNEEEQGKVEMMEDVDIDWIPFDYVTLTEEENNMLNSSERQKTSTAIL